MSTLIERFIQCEAGRPAAPAPEETPSSQSKALW